MTLKVMEMREKAQMPSRGTEGAAGLDLYCAEDFALYAGCVAKIPTGVAIEIPEGHYGLITGRSSTALKNVLVFPTVADSDYRGEIFITARFDGEGEYKIKRGDRIAQIVIQPYTKLNPEQTNELNKTERGSRGYGSTGK